MEKVRNIFLEFNVFTYLSITLIFIVLAFLFNMMRKSNAQKIVFVYVILFLAVGFSAFGLNMSKGEFMVSELLFLLSIVIIFSLEIKRTIWNGNKGKKVSTRIADRIINDKEFINQNISEITKAILNLSKNNTGAIIILSNLKMPIEILESGVMLNSQISSGVLESIFYPGTPLHDGAVVIYGNQVQAAGCFLPLSTSESIPKELGTRHRAGIGITERIDVTTIIVSEETGIISICKSGSIERYATQEVLKKTLKEYFWVDIIGGKNEK